MNKSTKASLCIPVYNEISFIKHTLNSAIDQEVDEIIISDNASTDGTSAICQEFAQKYPHIIYHRFDTIQSASVNFIKCISLAKYDYISMIGGHDLLSKNYISELKKTLETTESVLTYANPVHLTAEYVFKYKYEYYFSKLLCNENSSIRVRATIEHLTNCSLYYGLFRKDIYLEIYNKSRNRKYYSIDHGFLSMVAAQGKITLCPNATFYRIDPPREEETEIQRWERVLKALYADAYNPQIHFPELIPLGITLGQLLTAETVAHTSLDEKLYIEETIYILIKRRIHNEKALKLVVEEFQPIAKKYDINISKLIAKLIIKEKKAF